MPGSGRTTSRCGASFGNDYSVRCGGAVNAGTVTIGDVPNDRDVEISSEPAELPQALGTTPAAVTNWRIWEACSIV